MVRMDSPDQLIERSFMVDEAESTSSLTLTGCSVTAGHSNDVSRHLRE